MDQPQLVLPPGPLVFDHAFPPDPKHANIPRNKRIAACKRNLVRAVPVAKIHSRGTNWKDCKQKCVKMCGFEVTVEEAWRPGRGRESKQCHFMNLQSDHKGRFKQMLRSLRIQMNHNGDTNPTIGLIDDVCDMAFANELVAECGVTHAEVRFTRRHEWIVTMLCGFASSR